MNKRDIINKLQTDEKALECLSESHFASDLKIELEAKRQYISALLEWIEIGGKV
jgi:hypothetical protein